MFNSLVYICSAPESCIVVDVKSCFADSRYRGEREPVRFEGDGVWQWRDADNIWRPYDRKTNKEIEAACKKKSGISCLIERDGKQ